MSVPPEILAHYAEGIERPRLTAAPSLELVRTQQLLGRCLPAPPARIVDVGGGPATYAEWLAALGYDVHMVDPVPLHVEQARTVAASGPGFTASLGDARALDGPDGSTTPTSRAGSPPRSSITLMSCQASSPMPG
jgi:hypothetical protein